MSRIVEVIKDSKVLELISGLISDEAYLKLVYRVKMGEKLDLDNPKTFNEKLQWLKLNDRKDIYTNMVDKAEAKNYVASVIGKKYIIPTIGVYDTFDDIDFNRLPQQFVMKCTHDSGGLVICRDKSKLDIEAARKKINKCLKSRFYYRGREWPYKNVRPRIIVEKYMVDDDLNELRDYKFFCFDGVVKFFKVDFDRFKSHKANYYDKDAKLLKFGEAVCPPDFGRGIKMPKSLKKMIELAEKVSNNIPFVRMDFYSVNDAIFFGEMTFFPASGFGKFLPDAWDRKIGDMVDLTVIERRSLSK